MQFKIGELNIICSDIERSMAFYHDLLGFEVISEEEGAWHMKCGEVPFLLLPMAKITPERKPYCQEPSVSFDLLVEDAKAAFDFFKEHSVEFEMELEPNGSYFFIRDPDGLVIEIVG
ncbi:MAG: VOC family protein [Calditrichaeota bacterium]|nr:VOC family protein [Calditrichota bacterium]